MVVRNAASVLLVLVLALAVSTPSLAAPRDKTRPTAPSNLRVTAIGEKSVSLAWDAAKDNSSNWWYCVQNGGFGCIRVDPPKTTFTHPSLTPGQTYTFSVVAIDANGNRSAPSNSVTVTIPPDTTPPTAPVLSAGAIFPTRVTVNWTQSTDNTSQVTQTLLVDGSPYFGPNIGFTSAAVLYLAPESTHVFQVVAQDRFGNRSESNVLTLTTPPANDAVAPSAPTNLRLSFESSPPEAWLDWDAASDNRDPQAELLYEVFVNGVRASTGIGNVDDIVYCTATGANTITVRAVDTSGNASPFSNEIVFDC